MRMMKIFSILITLVLATGAAHGAASDLPFSPGEKLIFQLRWGFIPAGEATLEVHTPVILEGEPARHFVLTVRTNSVLDVVYKVRQRIDAYTDMAVSRSILYKEVHTINKTRRDALIKFDWNRHEARYINFGEENKPISISPGAFDPLSIFYFSRLFDFEKRKHLERPVTDGKKCVLGVAEVVKKEKIKVKNRIYDTYLIEPELKEVGGVFEKDKNSKIKIWVTADNRRIPVKIKSKVIVGSFVGDLISIEIKSPAPPTLSLK